MSISPSISKGVWTSLALLGFAGQLAWAVENQFFNTFMFDKIVPDPRPISWMVAASAVTATLTTILMGTLSDRTRGRWGRRRPFIFAGYLAWAVLTAAFPQAAFFRPVALAVGMAILFDCLMTYFGSTANDAALNAYVTDITTLDNRGKAVGVLEITKWLAILIVYGGSGIIIDKMGYYFFFYLIAALVLVVGVIGSSLIREPSLSGKPEGRYWSQIADSFRWRNLASNRDFFLVLLGVSLWAIAQNIYFPYLIIYLNHYLELDLAGSSITMAVVILVGGIVAAYPLGLLADRWGRRPMAFAAILAEMVGLVLFSFTRALVPLIITGIMWLAPLTAWSIATGAWSKDLFPEDKRGQFAGYYLFFWVMLPMILGPITGGLLVARFGIPITLNGQPGFVPTPLLFQVAGVGTLLAALPLFLTFKRQEASRGNA
jgi:MFS family permease